jgi:hypothetical protein
VELKPGGSCGAVERGMHVISGIRQKLGPDAVIDVPSTRTVSSRLQSNLLTEYPGLHRVADAENPLELSQTTSGSSDPSDKQLLGWKLQV